jgi:hypothetical protein
MRRHETTARSRPLLTATFIALLLLVALVHGVNARRRHDRAGASSHSRIPEAGVREVEMLSGGITVVSYEAPRSESSRP